MSKQTSQPGLLTRVLEKIGKIFGRNIATIVFGVLLLYMILSAIFYMTSTHIESYQVTAGPLSRNETFTALALHEEHVVRAESSGYLNYYAREGTKINARGVVFGLSTSPKIEGETNLRQEDLLKIREEMQSFSKGFDGSNFNNTYSFKYQVEGSILHYAGVTGESTTPDALSVDDLTDENGNIVTASATADSVTYGNQTLNKAESDGIVLYSKDNDTGKTVEDLTAADFDENSYHEEDLKTSGRINTGDDIYTLITDERWSLVIPLSSKRANRLSDRTMMRVKFLKDGMTQTGDFSIIEIEGQKYARIDFNKGLIRYAADRFLEVELVTNSVTGLKVPLSSIVTKEFYTIPASFASVSSSGTNNEFRIATRAKNGKTEYTVVKPTVYATIQDEDDSIEPSEEPTYTLYVDMSAFQPGDALVSKDGQTRYLVGDTGSLEGVYCINQGYAVFRRIEVLDQNEEYAIVGRSTSYGISKYDHIVKNADKVKEEDILY